jgi:CRISPR-associated protein Cas2
MMVLITYDVSIMSAGGAKRLRKIARECQNHGQRVQNSVFECVLSEAQFVNLRAAIRNIMNETEDNVRFYFLGNNWSKHIEMYGKVTSYNIDSELIL